MTNLLSLAHAAAKPSAGLRIGCPDIDAQQAEAFRRINGLTNAQANRLSRYCRGELEAWR